MMSFEAAFRSSTGFTAPLCSGNDGLLPILHGFASADVGNEACPIFSTFPVGVFLLCKLAGLPSVFSHALRRAKAPVAYFNFGRAFSALLLAAVQTGIPALFRKAQLTLFGFRHARKATSIGRFDFIQIIRRACKDSTALRASQTNRHGQPPQQALSIVSSSYSGVKLAKRVNSVNAKALSYANAEPSSGYIQGRCRDYWRGRVPLITSMSARPERDDIVHSLGNQRTKCSNTVTFEAITETEQLLTINVHEYAAFAEEDITKRQSKYDLWAIYTKAAGYALARGLDINLAALPQAWPAAQVIGSYGSEPAFADYIQAKTILDQQEVPDEDRVWVFSAAMFNALLKVDAFVNRWYRDEAPIEAGHMSTLLGWPVAFSNLLRQPAPGQSDSFYMHRNQIGLYRQQLPTSVQQYLIRNLADGYVTYHIYGFTNISRNPETPGGGTPSPFWGVLIKTIA